MSELFLKPLGLEKFSGPIQFLVPFHQFLGKVLQLVFSTRLVISFCSLEFFFISFLLCFLRWLMTLIFLPSFSLSEVSPVPTLSSHVLAIFLVRGFKMQKNGLKPTCPKFGVLMRP
jgi:hypothetical protein